MRILLIMAVMLGISGHTQAQNPSLNLKEGTKTSGTGIDLGPCRINILTAGYKLNLINGQPKVYTNIKWRGRDAASNCLSTEKFDLFLSIGTDSVPRYIYGGSSQDVIVGAGNYEWGSHPFSGVVSWDKLITRNFGSKKNLQFYTAEEAKAIWKAGFEIKTIKMVTESGRVFIVK